MSDDQYTSFWYDDLQPHKISLAWRDGCLLITLGSSGGQGGKARSPGRKDAFERLLHRLIEKLPSVRVKACRAGTVVGNRATRIDGFVREAHSTILEALTRGGANRFDLWLIEVPLSEIDSLARELGLQKHPDSRSQPEALDPLATLLPPLEARPIALPKPFVLLAGLSGTGKTSFVREQALRSCVDGRNFALIPVRPDWHEPSELLGYVSRLHGERFVATPFLKFIVSAWKDAAASANDEEIVLRKATEIPTFWACLDEMNLAPVEQYLADYLSVLESRSWDGDRYDSEALLPLHHLALSSETLNNLRSQLELSDPADEGLWNHFVTHGIGLPPNLVVAGTVNMDETTHGFSRKVIDRAFTLDFGAFYPTRFEDYFEPSSRTVTFTFPRRSRVSKEDLANCFDADGRSSIAFIEGINEVLRHTPFELAFRALNELLLAVETFAPTSEESLRAVWDDFVMTKILPRVEGDAEKLKFDGDASLLTRMRDALHRWFGAVDENSKRPDLFRTATSGEPILVAYRAPAALARMHERLTRQNFTSFWP
jgi:hypothetical protein